MHVQCGGRVGLDSSGTTSPQGVVIAREFTEQGIGHKDIIGSNGVAKQAHLCGP